jgi:hypothetical protein
VASFVINPVLEAISSEMLSTQYSLWQGQAVMDLEDVMGGEAVADTIGSQSWCAYKAWELYLYLPVADTIGSVATVLVDVVYEM